MEIRWWLFPALFTLSFAARSANENYVTGARAAALGGANITLTDIWSVNQNQAGLAFVSDFGAGIYYENRFLLKQTGLKSFAACAPTRSGVFGLSITQFGYTAYNEGKYGIAYARKLARDMSVGMQLNYVTTRIGDVYGKKSNVTAELGLRAKLVDDLFLGAHIYNLTHTRLNKSTNEYIPTVLRAGLEYRLSERAFIIAEAVHDSRNPLQVKSGVEFNSKNIFYLRAGISTNPFTQAFGVGIKYKAFQLDISSAYHYVLGFSPQVSLWASLGRKTEKNAAQPE